MVIQQNIKNILGSLRNNEFTTRCVYPFNRIVVDPYGYVVACTADFHTKLQIGDVRKKTLKEIWSSDEFQYLRTKHLKDEYKGLYCNKCLNNINCSTSNLREAFEKKL